MQKKLIKKNQKNVPDPVLKIPGASYEEIKEFTQASSKSHKLKKQSNKKTFYKGLNIAAAAVDPLMAIFLFYAIYEAGKYSLEELEIDTSYLELVLFIAAITLSAMSTICDLIVINPIEEAEGMIGAAEKNSEEQMDEENRCEQSSVKYFSYFNQIIANSTYLIAAASDAVAVAYLIRQPSLRWGLGVPTTLLGIVFYNMLTRVKVDEHSRVFIKNLLNCRESILINTAKAPLKSFEIILQTLANAINRSVVNGYILDLLLEQMFGLGRDNEYGFYAIVYITVATFYVSLFSRTLNVHKKFFNEQFKILNNEMLKAAQVSKLGMVIDSILIFLSRVIPTGTLIYRHGPENFMANLVITSGASAILLSHGTYARYINRLYKTALENHTKHNLSKNLPEYSNLSSDQMFDLIKNDFKNNHIERIVTVLNAGARGARWFAFLGFLTTLNALLKKHSNVELDFYDLLCVHQLWCIPSLENDASFYQDTLVDNITYYRTKLYMEKKSPNFGWASFWKSKSDYSENYLQEFLPFQILAIEEERVERANTL